MGGRSASGTVRILAGGYGYGFGNGDSCSVSLCTPGGVRVRLRCNLVGSKVMGSSSRILSGI